MQFLKSMVFGNAGAATAKCLPFVKIVEGKMALQAALDIPDAVPLRVVSILGKARMGKSTFLNAIVSKLKGRNLKPFATQDNDEHCTRGIDAYYCADASLLLLDCQGLALEDSSHDPALLLFAYLISDVIIFNERMMLQNEALKLLEPICAFMTYLPMDDIVKPRLYFRISDGDIVKDAGKNLEKVVCVRYNDQYQSIRDSITTLFHPRIGIVKTDSLDKGMKKRLAADEYLALFEDASLGFAPAIEEILAALPAGRPAGIWKASVPRFIESINRNDKITIEKLDVVGMVGKLALREWIDGLPESLFLPLPADGLQATVEAHIKPRQDAVARTLADFAQTFRTTGEPIKTPHYDKLVEKLNAPIRVALVNMEEAAKRRVAALAEVALKDRILTLSNVSRTLSSLDAAYWDTLLDGHRALEEACRPLYAPIKDGWLAWIHTCRTAVQTAVEEIRRREAAEQTALTTLSDRLVATTRSSILANIATWEDEETLLNWKQPRKILLMNPGHYAHQRLLEGRTAAVPSFRTISQYHEIVVTLRNQRCTATTRSVPFGEEHRPTISHNSLQYIWDTFVERITALRKEVTAAVTAQKYRLLCGRSVSETTTARILDVQFVGVHEHLAGKMLLKYVTEETYATHCAPLVAATFAAMRKEGYLAKGDEEQLCRKLTGGSNIVAYYQMGNHLEAAVSHLFEFFYARAIVLERTKLEEPTMYVRPPEEVTQDEEECDAAPVSPTADQTARDKFGTDDAAPVGRTATGLSARFARLAANAPYTGMYGALAAAADVYAAAAAADRASRGARTITPAI